MSLWFKIVITLSHPFLSSSIPSIAFDNLDFPSKSKGKVTIPTVNISNSFAIWAITGAAPVPVPPPIPAVMKSILVPSFLRISLISWLLSKAASLPLVGFAPAPSPFVNSIPIWIWFFTDEECKAWISVLHMMNSTFLIPIDFM